MKKEEVKTYLALGNELLNEVARVLNLTWDDTEMLCKDNEGNYLHWDEEMSYQVSIDVKEGKIIQINFWGDGTTEFQMENDEDSINWADFDKESLLEVIKVLHNIN